MSDHDFYVGYLPKSPESQGRFTRRIVVTIALLALVLVLALTFAQQKLPAANFEFGTVRHFQGAIESAPYPVLVNAKGERYLLVAPGKHGADDLVRGLAGES